MDGTFRMTDWPLGLFLCVLLVAAACCIPLCAQDQPGPEPPSPPSATDPEKLDPSLLDLFGEFQSIILLFSKSKLVLPDGVYIPIKLWEEMQRRLQAFERPVEGSISQLEIRGTVTEDHAKLTVMVQVTTKNPEGAVVDLKMPEAQLTAATDEHGRWPLIEKHAGGHRLQIDREGASTYTLEMFVDTTEWAPGEPQLTLTLPGASVKNAVLTSPKELLEVVDTQTSQKLPVSDRKTIEIRLRSDDSLHIAWRNVAGKAARGDFSAYSVDGTISVTVMQSAVQTNARLTIQAPSASGEWAFQLPLGEQIRSLDAEHAGRTLSPDELKYDIEPRRDQDYSRLLLRFAQPISGELQLTMLSDHPRAANERELQIGRLSMESASLQSGRVLVSTGPNLRLIGAKPDRTLRRIAVAQLEPELQRYLPSRVFQYFAQPLQLTVEVENAQPVVRASVDHSLMLTTENAILDSRFDVAIRGAPIQELRVQVPAAMTDFSVTPLNAVELAGQPLPEKSAEMKILPISIVEPTNRELTLTLRGVLPVKVGESNVLRLPVPVQESRKSTGTLTVSLAPNVRPILDKKSTKNLRQELMEDRNQPAEEVWWVFRQLQGPAQLGFRLERLPQQVGASIESEIRRGESAIAVATTIRLRAAHEPLENVVLRFPEGLQDVQVSGNRLLTEGVPTVDVVSFPLANPVETCEVHVQYRFPTSGPGLDKVRLPLVLPEYATIQSYKGNIWSEVDVRAVVPPPWESGPPAPDPVLRSSARPTLVVRCENPPSHLDLRFEPTATLASLVVPRLLVEEVLTAGGRRQGIVHFLVTDHRDRALTLRLPEGCRLLRVRVDGELALRIPHEGGGYRIRLPAAHRAFALQVVYACSSRRSLGSWNTLFLETPQIEEDAAIGEIRWLLRADEDRLLISTSAAIQSESQWQFRGFLGPPTCQWDRASAMRWLKSGQPDVVWGETELQHEGIGRLWAFTAWGDADRLQLWCVREPYWVLLCSGLCLVIGLVLSRSRTGTILRASAATLILTAALIAVVPTLARWVWLGAQWGIFLTALAILGRVIALGRQQRSLYRLGPSPADSRASLSVPSLIRRIQPAEEAPPPSASFGTTIDQR